MSTRSSRITVRQLESIVRLSEAIAKLHFSTLVTEAHAEAAVELFRNALSRVKKESVDLTDDEDSDSEEEMGHTGSGDGAQHTVTIDSTLFVLIQNQIINHVRELEASLALETDNGMCEGIKKAMQKSSVINWYVEEHMKEAVTEADRAADRRIVASVVRRMLNNDVLLMEAESLDVADMKRAGLRVHPNVEDGRRGVGGNKQKRLSTQFYAANASRDGTDQIQQQTRADSISILPERLELQDHEFLSLLYPS